MQPRALLLGGLALSLLTGLAACGGGDPLLGGDGADAVTDGGLPTPPDGSVSDPLRACMAATLPRLTVAGNQLMVRCDGQLVPARLKGLNRSGLQHKNGLMAAGFGGDPTPELRAYRDAWKAVIIRLPIAQTYYLFYDTYRADLDRIVQVTRDLGIYLMLELHGYDANNLDSAQPDPVNTPVFWGQVATRYGAQGHVLFDLWNEPHSVPWSTWKQNAEKIARAIRDAGASDTLLVVGGLDYAYDLSPLLDPQNRLSGLGPVIYATHPYPLKSNPPSMAPEWDQKFGRVAAQVPVIVSEYGCDDSSNSPAGLGSKDAARAWQAALHAYVDRLGLSALAWSSGDMPHLTLGQNGGQVNLPNNPPDPSRPTDPFGTAVQAWMRLPL